MIAILALKTFNFLSFRHFTFPASRFQAQHLVKPILMVAIGHKVSAKATLKRWTLIAQRAIHIQTKHQPILLFSIIKVSVMWFVERASSSFKFIYVSLNICRMTKAAFL